jgi:hypothetical protein
MEPADGIARLGFTRWYERQLIQGHAYLVTCFLCIVLVGVCLEAIGARASRLDQLLAAAAILGAGALGIHSLRRYREILLRAESFARGATCKSCRAYGRIKILESGTTVAEAAPEGRAPWLKVQCAKCGTTWTMG